MLTVLITRSIFLQKFMNNCNLHLRSWVWLRPLFELCCLLCVLRPIFWCIIWHVIHELLLFWLHFLHNNMHTSRLLLGHLHGISTDHNIYMLDYRCSSGLSLFSPLLINPMQWFQANYFHFLFLQNGSVLEFDMRQTLGPVKNFRGLTSNPVHSLYSFLHNSLGTTTVLSASSAGLCHWNFGGTNEGWAWFMHSLILMYCDKLVLTLLL